MKLSEVIKAIEEGSKSKFEATYKSGVGVERVLYGNGEDVVFCQMLTTLPYDDWQEIKPPRQWSEKELMLFKLLPKNINWLAKSGSYLWGFDNEPRFNKAYGWIVEDGCKKSISIENFFDFVTITHEESPVYIGDLK